MKVGRIALSVCMLAGGARIAAADQTCRPVVGHFEASVVPPGVGHCPNDPQAFCTAGRVWGGIQGDYQFVITAMVPSEPLGGVPTVLFFTGRSTIFPKSGDQVTGADTGTIDLPPGLGGFASLITFTGGTGAAAGTSGQIKLRGDFSPTAGTTTGDYRGSLCTP